MSKAFRRILFWFLFLLFLIFTPVAILYSQGYRFDNYKMIFIHSGSVTIKSVPANPNIFIDGKLRSSNNLDIINNSITIGGLRPGNYDISISSDGYSGWGKNTEVHSGLSTEFWNVVLVPNDLGVKQLNSSNVKRFFPSPFGKKVAYTQNSQNGFSLFIIDISKNEEKNIISETDLRPSDDINKNIEWNSKEDMLLCPVTRSSSNDYLIISDSGDFKPQFLSSTSQTTNPRNARWSPQENGIIYFAASDPVNFSNRSF